MTFDNRGRYFVICLFFVARIHEPLDGANGQGKEIEAQEEQSILVIDMEEFVVTSTKRERLSQEVPIAVTPYSETQIEFAGVQDIRELMAISPSLFLSSSGSESSGAVARIRGVGTTGDNPGLESAVGIFVDGVYRNRNNVGLTELGEVERIEVLRGPQGTLFGRNTSAGLINVITKAPEYQGNGYAEVGYGDYSNIRVTGGATGSLIKDVLAARIDAVFSERDGFLEDIELERDYNDRHRVLFRGQLLWEPDDFISVRMIGDYADRNEQCCGAVTWVPGPTLGLIQALGGTLLGDPFERKIAVDADRGYQQDVKEWGLSAEINWDAKFATVTSITAYRDWQVARSQDVDFTNVDILYRDEDSFIQGFETFTQELRAQGEIGMVDWLVGVFYSKEDLAFRDAIRTGAHYENYINGLVSGDPFSGFYSQFTGLAPGTVFLEGDGVVQDEFFQQSRSSAIFTHNTLTFADDFEFTVGLRYTKETKDLDASLLSNNRACTPSFVTNVQQAVASGLIPAEMAPTIIGLVCLPSTNPFNDGVYTGDREETEWSSTFSIAYNFGDDDLIFANYAHGYKGGGFNLDRSGLSNPLLGAIPSIADLEFEPETVDSFEVGGKFGLFDQRVTVNATMFYMDFEDFQLNSFNGIQFIVENLEEVTSRGLELETTALLSEGLTMRGGLTYADTKYGANISNASLAGQQLTNAPEWTVTGAATYERDLNGALLGFLHLNLRYMSSYNTGSDLDVEKLQDSFALVNGRIGIGSINGDWRLELWAKNLFDKDYIQIAFDAPLQGRGTGPDSTQTFNAFLGEPRTFGVTLRKQF